MARLQDTNVNGDLEVEDMIFSNLGTGTRYHNLPLDEIKALESYILLFKKDNPSVFTGNIKGWRRTNSTSNTSLINIDFHLQKNIVDNNFPLVGYITSKSFNIERVEFVEIKKDGVDWYAIKVVTKDIYSYLTDAFFFGDIVGQGTLEKIQVVTTVESEKVVILQNVGWHELTSLNSTILKDGEKQYIILNSEDKKRFSIMGDLYGTRENFSSLSVINSKIEFIFTIGEDGATIRKGGGISAMAPTGMAFNFVTLTYDGISYYALEISASNDYVFKKYSFIGFTDNVSPQEFIAVNESDITNVVPVTRTSLGVLKRFDLA